MKCPACKKGKLGTARTHGEDYCVRREKVCRAPKCGHRFWTLEMSEAAVSALRKELDDAKHQKDLEQYALERELSEIKGAVRTLFEAAQEKKKK